MLFVAALAILLLTLLGAAGESLGMDRLSSRVSWGFMRGCLRGPSKPHVAGA